MTIPSSQSAPPPPPRYPWTQDQVADFTRQHTRQVKLRGNYALRAVVWLLSRLVRSLSWKNADRFGRFIGRALYRFNVRRDVADTNLDIAFGESKTAVEKSEIYRKSLLNFGRQTINYLRIPLMDDKFWDENFELVNEHVLADAYNQGKGVIFLYAHFGPWELPGGKISHCGYPLAVVAKKVKNPVVDHFVVNARADMNLGTINHRKAMDRIMAGLQRGEGVIMVIDQNMKRSQGVFVNWMGRIASTVRSVAWIARETGAPVITGYSQQLGPGKFRMAMTEQIPWQPDPDPDQELVVNTQNYVNAVQKYIFDMPEEWFWLHRRWKVQPDGTPNPYQKKA